MREKVNAVENTKKVAVFQAAVNFMEALKLLMWNSDEKSEDLEDFNNLEDAELLPELKATVEDITAKAEKLNNRNQEPKVRNNPKGLKGNVQVVKAPTIQKAEFHYDKEKEKITGDKEISD